ncbi:hypothetical protein [Streptosporangium amethystogenes]|uniref:hypothetical protein n=1 Tax=Streptosporangium amethystogenes TaxID=2002 RepID=UPI0004CBEBDF|nr:hypothetical protein [Streptosporangium amethystogenes]
MAADRALPDALRGHFAFTVTLLRPVSEPLPSLVLPSIEETCAFFADAEADLSALVRHRDRRFDDGGTGADRRAFGNWCTSDGTDRFDLLLVP